MKKLFVLTLIAGAWLPLLLSCGDDWVRVPTKPVERTFSLELFLEDGKGNQWLTPEYIDTTEGALDEAIKIYDGDSLLGKGGSWAGHFLPNRHSVLTLCHYATPSILSRYQPQEKNYHVSMVFPKIFKDHRPRILEVLVRYDKEKANIIGAKLEQTEVYFEDQPLKMDSAVVNPRATVKMVFEKP